MHASHLPSCILKVEQNRPADVNKCENSVWKQIRMAWVCVEDKYGFLVWQTWKLFIAFRLHPWRISVSCMKNHFSYYLILKAIGTTHWTRLWRSNNWKIISKHSSQNEKITWSNGAKVTHGSGSGAKWDMRWSPAFIQKWKVCCIVPFARHDVALEQWLQPLNIFS